MAATARGGDGLPPTYQLMLREHPWGKVLFVPGAGR